MVQWLVPTPEKDSFTPAANHLSFNNLNYRQTLLMLVLKLSKNRSRLAPLHSHELEANNLSEQLPPITFVLLVPIKINKTHKFNFIVFHLSYYRAAPGYQLYSNWRANKVFTFKNFDSRRVNLLVTCRALYTSQKHALQMTLKIIARAKSLIYLIKPLWITIAKLAFVRLKFLHWLHIIKYSTNQWPILSYLLYYCKPHF